MRCQVTYFFCKIPCPFSIVCRFENTERPFSAMSASKPEDEASQSSQTQKSKKFWQIYVSRGLSNWGDRLWAFGIGIFMNKLDPSNLQLVAVFGFVMSISVIFFGPAIGGWVDRTKRLKSAITFLVLQNLTVAVTCVMLVIHFYWIIDEVRTLLFVSMHLTLDIL